MNPEPANDEADFHALRAGDTQALDRLIARWEQPLFAFAWRYLQNATDARDAVIEVFVRLFQHRERLRADTRLPAWLFTTLANLCHNQHRWRRRHPLVSLDGADAAEPGGAFPAPTPAPNLAAEHDERVAALGTAIAGLPPELKTAVLLHHYEGWSYRAIAEATSCSERGVETRLYRARQRLRAELGEHRLDAVLR